MFNFDDHQMHARRPALIDGPSGRVLTYSGLRAELDLFGRSLDLSGRGLAFLFCRNNLDSVVAYLALMRSEHAVALLDDALDLAARTALIERYRPELVLDSGAHDYSALEYRRGASHGPATWRTGPSPEDLDPRLKLLLTTSGSTGSPKFVRLSHDNVAANTRSICEALAIGPDDRAITTLPIFYTYGLSVLNTHISAGASVVVTEEGVMSPALWELVRATECTTLSGVPYTYRMLDCIGFDSLDIPKVRALTQAGGRLEPEAVTRFAGIMRERGGALHVMYGQTEATARIACLPPGDLPAKAGSVGRAIPRGHLSIEVDGLLTREPGVAGEVVYQGPNVMMGYATERAHLSHGNALGGMLHTGDIGSFDDDGYLRLEGRSSRIAKLFGVRLNLDEVEARLAHLGPTAALQRDESVVLYCAWGDATQLDEHRRALARGLRINHRAFEVARLEELPHTSSGKVDYKSLVALR